MARILVIDDEPSIAHVIRLLLEAQGHEVLVADDGSRGVATAQRRSPDAIVLDVMMPFMDGFGVLEALRADARTSGVPVMMLSALSSDAIEQRCLALGAKKYVEKPFEGNELLRAVEETLAWPTEPAPVADAPTSDGRGYEPIT
jgi:DNA-binding response OmpR family regulator